MENEQKEIDKRIRESYYLAILGIFAPFTFPLFALVIAYRLRNVDRKLLPKKFYAAIILAALSTVFMAFVILCFPF